MNFSLIWIMSTTSTQVSSAPLLSNACVHTVPEIQTRPKPGAPPFSTSSVSTAESPTLDSSTLDEDSPTDTTLPSQFSNPVRDFFALASTLSIRLFNRQRPDAHQELSALSPCEASPMLTTSVSSSPIQKISLTPSTVSSSPSSVPFYSPSSTSTFVPILPLSALDELVSTPRAALSLLSAGERRSPFLDRDETVLEAHLHSFDSPSSSPTVSSLSPSRIPPPLSLDLKSPRGLLRSSAPKSVSQNARMDLLLLQDTPTIDDIQLAAWNGCNLNNRPQVWRMLVDYEPIDHSTRLPTLRSKRAQYRHFVRVLYAPLGQIHFDCSSPICTAQVDNLDVYNVDRDGYIDDSDFFICASDDRPQHASPSSTPSSSCQFQTTYGFDSVQHSIDFPTHAPGHTPQQPYGFQGDLGMSESRVPGKKHVIEYSNFSARTLRQIEMDLPRTHPSLPVFHLDAVRNAMRRILYTFGMINPNNNYVQGMNEILTPIIVVFLTEWLPRNVDRSVSTFLTRCDLHGLFSIQQLADAEADAFWTFSAIVSAIGDNFIADQPGILRRVARLEDIVNRVDPSLAVHLARNGNHFLQFSFRWMNCLLMRELPFPLVIKLWDALLARPDGVADLHVYVCAALLIRFSGQLKVMDFEECIMLLQRLPTEDWSGEDVDELLSQASIWKERLGFPSLAL